jgi:hypothetical protein
MSGFWGKCPESGDKVETFEKHPLSPDFGVRLKLQSSKYAMYSCG